MKKINRIQGALRHATFFAALLLVVACNTSQEPADTKTIAQDKNDDKFDNPDRAKDADFLVDAAEVNMEEIRLGQLAQQMGTTSYVKDLGKKMEDAHTGFLGDLKQLAKSKNITLPSAPTDNAQADYSDLSSKSGNNFDKAYTDLMVSKHNDAIELFERASSECTDIDIKNWASISLPELRAHLNHSENSQEQFEAAYLKNGATN